MPIQLKRETESRLITIRGTSSIFLNKTLESLVERRKVKITVLRAVVKNLVPHPTISIGGSRGCNLVNIALLL